MKVIAINIVIFFILLVFLEIVLRVAGKDSIVDLEKKFRGGKTNISSPVRGC